MRPAACAIVTALGVACGTGKVDDFPPRVPKILLFITAPGAAGGTGLSKGGTNAIFLDAGLTDEVGNTLLHVHIADYSTATLPKLTATITIADTTVGTVVLEASVPAEPEPSGVEPLGATIPLNVCDFYDGSVLDQQVFRIDARTIRNDGSIHASTYARFVIACFAGPGKCQRPCG